MSSQANWIERLRDPDFRLGPADRGMIAHTLAAYVEEVASLQASLVSAQEALTDAAAQLGLAEACIEEAEGDAYRAWQALLGARYGDAERFIARTHGTLKGRTQSPVAEEGPNV